MTLRRSLLLIVLLLALTLAACRGSGDETEATITEPTAEMTAALLPTPTMAQAPPATATIAATTPALQATKPSANDIAAEVATATPTPTATATATPAAEQTQQFSWSGGYSYWPPLGYETQTNGGQTLFTGPEGVMALAGGPEQNSSRPPEQAMAEALGAINGSTGASLTTGAPFPVTVGGVPGIGADLSGATPQGAMLGRLVTVRPNDGQLFYAFGLSPAQLWSARDAARFQRLLGDVGFFPLGSQFGCPRSLDPTYGFSPDNPIRIGGGDAAPQREAAYLGALRAANGQVVPFQPAGSQQHGDRTLNVYTIPGAEAGAGVLYFDPSVYEPLFAPVGFGCVGAIPVGAP
ncbi:MAG: hypothetical protein K1X50_16520 [Candidatus Promineofilum sp.]|nr:hypothetical protein [Promineifilum sp.]MCW5865278.1 hypothetical protein [Anaerolineae bacterium]